MTYNVCCTVHMQRVKFMAAVDLEMIDAPRNHVIYVTFGLHTGWHGIMVTPQSIPTARIS